MDSMRQIAEKIAEIPNRDIGKTNMKCCENVSLTKDNFFEIPPPTNHPKIACIDGGNQEIFSSPECSAQFNRVYFNIFKDNKRINIKSDIPQRIEFLSLTTTKQDKNKFSFETTISPIKDEFYQYLPKENDLEVVVDGITTASKENMEIMASKARRFTEWIIAKRLIESELINGDIIVRDGSLQTSHPKEDKLVKDLFEEAVKKGIILTGLSKTCRLTTTTQLSIIAAVQRLANESNLEFGKWVYYPIAGTKQDKYVAKIMVVKLNEIAYNPFRFEILKEQAENEKADDIDKILDIISSIADQSNDLSLPGYPYGLIDADRWARVTYDEIDGYKTRLNSEISKTGNWEYLKPHTRAVSAHDELDKSIKRG